jgi:hypothetical protein
MQKEFKDLMSELRDYPRLIHDAERKAEDLRETWGAARVKREYNFSASFLRNKAKGMPEATAKHAATQECFEADQALIAAESQYRKAMADHTYLDNQFQAARKIANMQEAVLMKLGTFE